MKNKGFTIIELAISFCMVTAISIALFQLVLSMRDLYYSGNVKTVLLNKQGILTKRIYDDLYNYELKSITSCGLSCLQFVYLDPSDSSSKIAELSIDPYNVSVTYDNYSIQLDDGSYFGQVKVTNDASTFTSSSLSNSLFKIEIPIYNKLVDGNYGIEVVYQYNSLETTFNNNIDISNVTITLDNQDLTLLKYSNEYYARIFYHNVQGGVFNSLDEFIKSNNANKFSALYALDLFKGKYSSENANGFEFLLSYPNLNASYNQWFQENNFLKKPISGYEAIDILWNAGWNGVGHFNGINLIDEDNTCGYSIMTNELNANGNCYMTLGAKKLINNSFMVRSSSDDFSTNAIALYTRADEYLNKYALSNILNQ